MKNKFSGKTISIVGIGISNTPLINILYEMGAKITARDKSESLPVETMKLLSSKNIKTILGADYLKNIDDDYIIKTPILRPDLPEFENAVKNGSILTSEMQLFFEYCPCKIIAITGSDGKTTTTTLIYKLLQQQGYNCHLGGNIGTPLLPLLDEIKKEDYVVVELSSFQLFTMTISPHIAVITNITPNHLDVHKSFEEYIKAKQNIYKFQTKNDILILNKENKTIENVDTISEIKYFSSKQKTNGAYIKDNKIYLNDNEIMSTDDILLKGKHNQENYLAAISATDGLVSKETIISIAKTFGGVEHRLEFVRDYNGIKFYNSSIDSSPSRTIAALSTFNEKIILIAGGKDKGIKYDEIGEPICKKVKSLILIGATAPLIEESVKNSDGEKPKIIFCSSYEEIIKTITQIATKGDNVLLSPASTSFDMFKNFEDRGNTYKKLVQNLK